MKLLHNRFIPYFLKNHRPACILPGASKTFKRIMEREINDYISKILFKIFMQLQEVFSNESALIPLIERRKLYLD